MFLCLNPQLHNYYISCSTEIKDQLSSRECEKFEAECLRNPYSMWTKCRASCLKSLPPIPPYLHVLTGGSPASPGGQTPYGHPAMTHGMSAFPGFPQGNNTAGKKTSSASLEHKVKKKSQKTSSVGLKHKVKKKSH